MECQAFKVFISNKIQDFTNLKQASITLLLGVMRVQDEVAKGRIQLPLDFLIKVVEEESCDQGLTLLLHVLCQSQNDQATERNNLINHIKKKISIQTHKSKQNKQT